ncbi:MAG: Gmad2 immunoglobulin-like domain-containing protein [Dehalococcoidia bacterium]|jgi:hypothetical protein
MRRLKLIAGIVGALSFAVLLLACGKAEAPEGAMTATPSTPVAAAITVDEPQPNAAVNVPVTVKGTASVFEGTVQVAVKDASGKTLCQTFATASEGAPGRGSFQTQVFFPPPETEGGGTVEVFSESPKDGSVQDLVSVPVTFSSEQPAVVVTAPVCGAQVKSPVFFEGTASGSLGTFVIVVRDSLGNELARAIVQPPPDQSGTYPFEQQMAFPPPSGSEPGTIEALSTSASDGSAQTLFLVPVTLTP